MTGLETGLGRWSWSDGNGIFETDGDELHASLIDIVDRTSNYVS